VTHALLVDRYGRNQIMWLPGDVHVGQPVRWNGKGWHVSAVYGTHFCMGRDVRHRDHPPRSKDEPNIPDPNELLEMN